MKIIMASNNRNKLKELSQIVPEHSFVLPEDEGINFDFDETGSTYLENSLGKALALYNMLKIPVIADDSGLSVPSLGGEPGIYSAVTDLKGALSFPMKKETSTFLIR